MMRNDEKKIATNNNFKHFLSKKNNQTFDLHDSPTHIFLLADQNLDKK